MIARRVARQEDPVTALQFVYRYGEQGEQFDKVAGDIVGSWSRDDPAATRSWIENLPRGPERDYSLRAYTESAADISPADACRLGATIESESIRRWALEPALRNWALADRPAALACLERSALPEREKQELGKAAE